jgi:glycosyltransferase involved in cell wall biosynthesis
MNRSVEMTPAGFVDSRPMRIALVNQPWSVSPPDNSADSIALVTYQLARRVAHDAQVRCYGRILADRPRSEVIDGVEYRRVSAKFDKLLKGFRLLDQWQLMPPRRPFHQSPFYHIAYALAVARDLQKSPCDIVHVHNFAQCARIIRMFNPAIRVVLHMHCDWLTQLDERMVGKLLTSVDMVLGVSQYISQKAQRRFGSGKTRFHTLYNGVDFDRFAAASPIETGVRRILFVGRLSPEKGPHVLLKAFKQIASQFPDVALDLIGPDSVLSREFVDPGREDPDLERLTSFFSDRASYGAHLRSLVSPDLKGRVRFVGTLPYDDLPTRYASAEMLVVPSVFDEPFGLPLAEAMAAGVPCIATQAGAFPEIVDHQRTGLLVPRADASALAAAIREILTDPHRSREMGTSGRERCRLLFSWDQNAKILGDYFRGMMEHVLHGPGEHVRESEAGLSDLGAVRSEVPRN